MSVKGRGPDRASGLDDGDRLRFALVVVGYCVLRISSNVSSLMGGGYWASCSSFSESCISLTEGSWTPGVRYVGAGVGVAVARRINISFVGEGGMVCSGGGLHGASNTPGP